VVAILGAAVAVAAIAFATTGARLATAPSERGEHPDPFPSALPTGALARLAQQQTADDRAAAAPLGRLPGFPEVVTARLLGRPDGLVVVGWITNAGEVCVSAYRPGPSVEPESSCAMRADFLDGGVSIRWPDSPDLGPFDIRWLPTDALDLTSARPPGGIPVTPAPNRTATASGGG